MSRAFSQSVTSTFIPHFFDQFHRSDQQIETKSDLRSLLLSTQRYLFNALSAPKQHQQQRQQEEAWINPKRGAKVTLTVKKKRNSRKRTPPVKHGKKTKLAENNRQFSKCIRVVPLPPFSPRTTTQERNGLNHDADTMLRKSYTQFASDTLK